MNNSMIVLPTNEAPTMSSVEMVDYINAIAESAENSVGIRELDGCLELIEGFRKSIPKKYLPLCKAIYCHINSLIAQKIADSQQVDSEQGVYLIEFDDGFVKIGMTATSFSKRLQTITNQTSANIKRSEFITCENPSKVEAGLHRHFADVRGNGEFFRVSFDDCLRTAKLWADKYGKKPKTSAA